MESKQNKKVYKTWIQLSQMRDSVQQIGNKPSSIVHIMDSINYNLWLIKIQFQTQQVFKVIMKIIIIITIYQEFFFCKISYKLCYHA